ncbi:MAG: hypothetical protein WC770_02470 [Phycisphaerae bacterium]|jgi:hypothetical protein
MPAIFNHNSTPYGWQINFDLGVTFTEISHIYIDWSGGITAGLAQMYSPFTFQPVGEPFPVDVGIEAYLGRNPHARIADFYGGQTTYPTSEPFNSLSEFAIDGATTWSDLLDGTGTIWIGYTEPIFIYGGVVEHGSIVLNSATIMVDGTVIPEPVTFTIIAIGLPVFRVFLRRKI